MEKIKTALLTGLLLLATCTQAKDSKDTNPLPPPLPPLIKEEAVDLPKSKPKQQAFSENKFRTCKLEIRAQKSYSVPADESTLTIKASSGWSKCINIIQAEEWMDYDITDNTLIITITDNPLSETRKGSIQIYSGNYSWVIDIKQSKSEYTYVK